MNPFADAARRAVTDPAFDATTGHCQVFARQVVQSVVGGRHDAILWKPSALEAMEALVAAGHGVDGPPRPGDLLYKGRRSGPAGHVGVYVGDGKVAENSSTKVGRVQGAKGYRTLKQYGTIDAIVRLEHGHEWAVVLPTGKRLAGVEKGGHVWLPARLWAEAIGFGQAVTWDKKAGAVSIGGKHIGGPVEVEDGVAWCQVTELATAAGLGARAEGDAVTIYRP